MRFAWLVAGAALTFIVVAGCSSQGSPVAGEKTGANAQAIQNGSLDTGHPFAVGLCGGSKNNCLTKQNVSICSGALILPNLVVTARHCVDQSPEQIDCSQNPSFGSRMFGPGGFAPLWVTTSADLSTNAGYHSVKKIFTPTDTHVCGNDIALLVLNDIIAGNEAKPIVPGVQYPMNDPKYATRFTAIGYGLTSPAPGGTGSGTRRIKTRIRVLCIPGDEFIDCPADANGGTGVNPREFIGGDGTCQGDSGSSAYEESTFDTPGSVSFGVLSRGGQSADGTMCQGSLYTRLDAWRDLVIQAADDASNNWTNYPKPTPDWTVYVPPPVKDAGTDAKAPPSTTPSGLGFGEACTDAVECTSKQCIDPGDGNFFCSKTCTDSSACPDGYECPPADGVCVPVKAKTPATTTTTSGCSVGVGPQPQPWRWGGVGLGLAALAMVRRRRR